MTSGTIIDHVHNLMLSLFSIRYMKRMRKAQKAKLEADEAHH
jgi:hypothetical protein